MEEDDLNIPKKKSVFLLVILSILTLGIYPIIWYTKRSDELNNLRTEKKIRKSLTILPLLFLISAVFVVLLNIFFGIVEEWKVVENNDITQLPLPFIVSFILVVLLISLYMIIFYFFMPLRTKKILDQALANKGTMKENKVLKLSWFFSLVFNLFYLQYEINRIITDKELEKRKGPWIVLIIYLILIIAGVIIQLLFPELFSFGTAS